MTLSPEAVYALRSGAALCHDLDAEIDRLARDLDAERTQRNALAERCIAAAQEIGELKLRVKVQLDNRDVTITQLWDAQARLVDRCNELARALAKKSKNRPTDDMEALRIVTAINGAVLPKDVTQ